MDKDKRQGRIDEYLQGKGSPDVRREFEEETSRNEDLSRELGDTELAMAAIEMAEDQALKARLQVLEQRLSAETPGTIVAPPLTAKTSPKPQAKVVEMRHRRKGQFRLMAYAAALLLVLAVGWWSLAQPGGFDAQQLAMDSFTPYKNIATGTVRGGDEETAKTAAFAAYDAGNYAEAVDKLSALPYSDVHNFYLGQSLLAQQKYAEAQEKFIAIMDVPDFPLAQEAGFYNALAWLGRGNVTEARNALTKISRSEEHEMKAEAKALLAEM